MNTLQGMPKNKEIEEVVLGAMIVEPSCMPLVVAKLHEDVFYFDLHRYIYRAAISLYDESKPSDLPMVVERMNRMGLFSDTIRPFEVMRVTQSVVSSANIEAHVLILQQYYLQREAISLGSEMIKRGYSSDPFDTLDSISAEILKLQERATKGHQKSISDQVVQVIKERDMVLQNGSLGNPTNIKVLDNEINGLVAPDLIIIAARPGMGKTALALSIVHNVCIVNKEPTALFSLEMSASQIITRLESINSSIPHAHIRKNDLSTSERGILANTDSIISCSPLYIDDSAGLNIRELRTKANILKRKFGIRHIVIDYLQLMSGVDEKGKSRENIISEISRGCKVIAKELGCTVIALSQLSRQVEGRTDKMPQLSDLRESGSIEQDADIVMFLMRPEYYDMTEPVEITGVSFNVEGLSICKIAKNRHASPKNIPLRFEGHTMKYSDYDYLDIKYRPLAANVRNYYEAATAEDTPF